MRLTWCRAHWGAKGGEETQSRGSSAEARSRGRLRLCGAGRTAGVEPRGPGGGGVGWGGRGLPLPQRPCTSRRRSRETVSLGDGRWEGGAGGGRCGRRWRPHLEPAHRRVDRARRRHVQEEGMKRRDHSLRTLIRLSIEHPAHTDTHPPTHTLHTHTLHTHKHTRLPPLLYHQAPTAPPPVPIGSHQLTFAPHASPHESPVLFPVPRFPLQS